MKLSSPAFRDNEQIPTRYTCDGEDVSPPIEITEVPPRTVCLALLVDDLDARGVEGEPYWVHWVLLNIPPDTARIDEGRAPEGVMQGRTSFHSHRYGGPCPPLGVHRYRFRAFALSKELDVDRDRAIDEIEKIMKPFILDTAEFIGTYCRRPL